MNSIVELARQTVVLPAVILFSLIASFSAVGAPPRTSKPNILFILADDLGMDGVSCYGADRYRTPNIDALARAGVRFQNCYATPLCGPSRCQLMTGRYPFRTGGETNQSWKGKGGPTPGTEIPIATWLKQAGYATGQAGKWRQLSLTPREWGFDEYCTDPVEVGFYWTKSYILNGQAIKLNHTVYAPDIVQQFATDFIQRHANEPWFFYYASHLVHIPIERTPDSNPRTRDSAQLYTDNIVYLDKQVGQLVASVAASGQLDNTVIVFSGDNGSAGKPGTIGGRRLFGTKGTLTEGGSRVPLIASWHGVSPAGSLSSGIVDFSDLFPTFSELAGAGLPPNVIIDGQSFVPQLAGGSGSRIWAYVQLGEQWFVRSGNWKLNNRDELFDMSDAPFTERPATYRSDPTAAAARISLQSILNNLHPASGK